MKYPNIMDVRDVVKSAQTVQAGVNMPGLAQPYYVPARPLGFASPIHRLRATWLVFTGQADAVTWPQQ